MIGPLVDQFPFAHSDGAADSTVTALGRVHYATQYDLGRLNVYDPATLERVWIVRESSHVSSRLLLYPVFDGDRSDDSIGIQTRAPIGVLRPSQRYVTTSGLVRARVLSDTVVDLLNDRWGYGVVESDARRIRITPPILERMHPVDRDVEEESADFIVCDGNHRIVERVWRRRLPTAAVAAIEAPAEPYYILPLPETAWSLVSDAEVGVAPARDQKYTVRGVELTLPGSPLWHVPASERYRRYFRSLETGFDDLGGQAGSD